MKLSVTAFLALALLVVSLGLIVTAAAEGEMNVDAAMAVDDPSVSTLAATDKDGEPDAEGPVSDADDLGPIEDGDDGLVPDEEDGIEGDYNDGLEVDPSDDIDDDEELADDEDEDIVVIDDDEEKYNEIDDGYEDPELYDADDNDEFAPETDNADDAERLGDEFAAGEEEGSYPQRDGQKHHHHHHQEPHIHLRCHPAHIALFLLVAVAIGLASRRLRKQRRAAYQSVAQPPNGEVPVVVVMGKLKEEDDDVSHGGVNDGFPLGRPVSSIPCTAVV